MLRVDTFPQDDSDSDDTSESSIREKDEEQDNQTTRFDTRTGNRAYA